MWRDAWSWGEEKEPAGKQRVQENSAKGLCFPCTRPLGRQESGKLGKTIYDLEKQPHFVRVKYKVGRRGAL